MIDRNTAKFFNLPYFLTQPMPGSPLPLNPMESTTATWHSRPAVHAASFPPPSEKKTLVFNYPEHNVTGAVPAPTIAGIHDPSACMPQRPSLFPPPFQPQQPIDLFPYRGPMETSQPIPGTQRPTETIKAPDLLLEAADTLKERATQRDAAAQGERSMKRTIDAFNALTGKGLTEAEGWEFMVLLKLVRGRQGAFRKDDYVDGAAYCALLGECESKADKK